MNFLVADDHSVVLMGLKIWIQAAYTNAKIDEATNAAETLALVRQNEYDLVIIDVQMSDTSDFGLITNLMSVRPDLKVIVMSILNEEIYGPRFLQAGAKSYLAKNTDPEAVMSAIKKVLAGRKYVTEKIMDVILEYPKHGAGQSPFELLTEREMEITRLFLSGMSNGKISKMINLHSSTVANHKINIFKKLNIETIVELINIAKVFRFQVM